MSVACVDVMPCYGAGSNYSWPLAAAVVILSYSDGVWRSLAWEARAEAELEDSSLQEEFDKAPSVGGGPYKVAKLLVEFLSDHPTEYIVSMNPTIVSTY